MHAASKPTAAAGYHRAHPAWDEAGSGGWTPACHGLFKPIGAWPQNRSRTGSTTPMTCRAGTPGFTASLLQRVPGCCTATCPSNSWNSRIGGCGPFQSSVSGGCSRSFRRTHGCTRCAAQPWSPASTRKPWLQASERSRGLTIGCRGMRGLACFRRDGGLARRPRTTNPTSLGR